jgi:hypothetical protein
MIPLQFHAVAGSSIQRIGNGLSMYNSVETLVSIDDVTNENRAFHGSMQTKLVVTILPSLKGGNLWYQPF